MDGWICCTHLQLNCSFVEQKLNCISVEQLRKLYDFSDCLYRAGVYCSVKDGDNVKIEIRAEKDNGEVNSVIVDVLYFTVSGFSCIFGSSVADCVIYVREKDEVNFAFGRTYVTMEVEWK